MMSDPNKKPWTQQEHARANYLRERVGLSFHRIGEMMGRSKGSVEQKLMRSRGVGSAGLAFGARQTSKEQEADRERRRDALHRRDITATLCGDPAPGYSALDWMQQQRGQ